MPDTSSEDIRSRDTHQKWLARRMYHETLSTSRPPFLNWPGAPNRCKCGCGDVWFDRVSPTNWWNYFSPGLLIQTGFLFPIFHALHGVIWALPPVAWYTFQNVLASHKKEAPARHKLHLSITVILALPASVILWTLWPISLALLTTLLFLLAGIAVIAIGMFGITLILTGLASMIYLTHPAIGTALIVVGILFEYERNRRKELKQEELLGNLILKLRKRDDQSKAPSGNAAPEQGPVK